MIDGVALLKKDKFNKKKIKDKNELDTIIHAICKHILEKNIKNEIVDLNNFDVSQVTDFTGVFMPLSDLIDVMDNGIKFEISKWNLSNATNITSMFAVSLFGKQYNGTNLINNFTQTIQALDFSNVKKAPHAFAGNTFDADIYLKFPSLHSANNMFTNVRSKHNIVIDAPKLVFAPNLFSIANLNNVKLIASHLLFADGLFDEATVDGNIDMQLQTIFSHRKMFNLSLDSNFYGLYQFDKYFNPTSNIMQQSLVNINKIRRDLYNKLKNQTNLNNIGSSNLPNTDMLPKDYKFGMSDFIALGLLKYHSGDIELAEYKDIDSHNFNINDIAPILGITDTISYRSFVNFNDIVYDKPVSYRTVAETNFDIQSYGESKLGFLRLAIFMNKAKLSLKEILCQ